MQNRGRGSSNFASLGAGTAAHVAAVVFNQAAGIDAVHVPFKSLADVYSAVISGEVHYYVFLVPSALPPVRSGKARALAVTGAARATILPDVPTVVEAGLPGAQSDAMLGIVGPANLPREIVTRLHAEIVAVLRKKDTQDRYAPQSVVMTLDTTPDQYDARRKAEYGVYKKLIETLGLGR